MAKIMIPIKLRGLIFGVFSKKCADAAIAGPEGDKEGPAAGKDGGQSGRNGPVAKTKNTKLQKTDWAAPKGLPSLPFCVKVNL